MKALIIANGSLPSMRIVRSLEQLADVVICADGGANHARALHIQPTIILGDFDSVTASTKRYFKDVPQLHINNEHSTDLEKAIQYCIEQGITSADIIGAFGDRLDHTTGSLGCFKKFGKNIGLRFVDSVGVLTRIKKSETIKTKKGEKLSLIPFGRCVGVTTNNLKYELNNSVVEIGVQEGISNEALSSSISVSVKKGILLLYRFH
ncbi:MAG: thiamine diphosphokinase [Ignavibacteriae bacterium]|nr:thiamine diphosphokinase [Ignavibacteriota bacterium]